jgi:hypothetical protein
MVDPRHHPIGRLFSGNIFPATLFLEATAGICTVGRRHIGDTNCVILIYRERTHLIPKSYFTPLSFPKNSLSILVPKYIMGKCLI